MSTGLIETLKQEKKQSEFGRKGLQMINQARDLLTREVNSIPKTLSASDRIDRLLETTQRFLNRVDAVLAGVRDENDVMFKAGVHWTKAAQMKHETTTR